MILLLKNGKVIASSAGEEIYSITDGLKIGEKVVIKGAFYLKSELLKSELGGRVK